MRKNYFISMVLYVISQVYETNTYPTYKSQCLLKYKSIKTLNDKSFKHICENFRCFLMTKNDTN